MLIKHEIHGEIEIDEAQIITFPEGVYGFPDSRRFAIIGEMTEDFPFVWLQSLDEENAVFVITTPFLFKENYDFELSDRTVEELEIADVDDVLIYSMVVIPSEVKASTINLKAPVILNKKNRKGRQVVLNEDYPYKYRIFERENDPSC